MTTAQLQITNDSGVIILSDERNTLVLLQKGGSAPVGTMFGADGSDGLSYWFGKPQGGASSSGFQIFDADGVLTFDALRYGRLARPVGTMIGTLGVAVPEITVTKTFAIPAGKVYAVWIHKLPAAFRVRSMSNNVGGTISYGYALDDQEVSVSFTPSLATLTATRVNGSMNDGGSRVPYVDSGDPIFRSVVLDVTNF